MSAVSRKKAEVFLEYAPYIEQPPLTPNQLLAQASSNDGATIDYWREQWASQIKANHAVFGPFKGRSLAKIYKAHLNKPCILLGSGPSLKKNAHLLKDVSEGFCIISCLHNFHFCEDLGIKVDYYVTLDAGDVTIKEVSEGGDPEVDYWEKTKGKTLLAYIGSHPNLLAKWQGEILFFNSPMPDETVHQAMEKLEHFPIHITTGGNVFGACLYIARAYLGCYTSIFLGADFSFSYDESFYPWKTNLDGALGGYIKHHDIYGIPVKTWGSYRNFKSWFESFAMQVPGEYINCTEGGIFGSYAEGNIRAIQQRDLKDCLDRFSVYRHVKEQVENPEVKQIKIIF